MSYAEKKNKPGVTLITPDATAVGFANAGDVCLIPRSGRSPRNGNPVQYSCWGNPMDRGAWWARVHWVSKSWI